MKIFNSIKSYDFARIFTLLAISIGILAITSCKKQEEIITTTGAYLRLINTSPTLGTFDAYINTKKANLAPFPFGGTTKYVQPSSGQCDIKFTIANETQTLFAKSVNLSTNVAYSYYLIGKDASLDGILITDVMLTTSPDRAYVKFINLSPDAPTLSLNIIGGTTLANNLAYKNTSEFAAVDIKTQSFEIKESLTGAVKTTLLDQPLTGGRYYTIIARGLLNPGNNEQAFSAQSIINQ